MFLACMRVRVPNFRLQIEASYAAHGKATMIFSTQMQEIMNEIEEKIKAAKDKGNKNEIDILINVRKDLKNGNLDVAISPQTSLIGIHFIKTLHKEFSNLNWSVIKTEFEQCFVTTDNPVVWYDLETISKNFIPYQNGLEAQGLEVIFPLTKRLILVGNRFFPDKFSYRRITKEDVIKQLNERLIISAEEYIYSSQNNLEGLIEPHKNLVPRAHFINIPNKNGYTIITESTLGPPHNLIKWKKK